MQLYIRKRVPISNALGLVFMAVFLDGSSPTYHLFVSMSKDDNELSSWYTFSCGVLPGSVLDPLLLYFSLNSGSHTGSVSLYPPLELTTRRTASKFFCALYWRRRANMSTASVAVLAWSHQQQQQQQLKSRWSDSCCSAVRRILSDHASITPLTVMKAVDVASANIANQRGVFPLSLPGGSTSRCGFKRHRNRLNWTWWDAPQSDGFCPVAVVFAQTNLSRLSESRTPLQDWNLDCDGEMMSRRLFICYLLFITMYKTITFYNNFTGNRGLLSNSIQTVFINVLFLSSALPSLHKQHGSVCRHCCSPSGSPVIHVPDVRRTKNSYQT